jgi:glucose-1-phosphate cytidylyltransferase
MKAVILAGGFGTRISEETLTKPKPMIEIGGRPLLWHIMKIYSKYDINDFIICLGYKGYMIKEYFANYLLHMSDVTFDMRNNSVQVHNSHCEAWTVTLVDTGMYTKTGGRIKRISSYLGPGDFLLTYGDGVADINLKKLIRFHQNHDGLATMTAVMPPGRFGAIEVEGDLITKFREKPKGDQGWINGGFFVLSPKVMDYIDGDDIYWEREPLERLAADGQIRAYKHRGFWHAMDTLRDKNKLDELWQSGEAPWNVWG